MNFYNVLENKNRKQYICTEIQTEINMLLIKFYRLVLKLFWVSYPII